MILSLQTYQDRRTAIAADADALEEAVGAQSLDMARSILLQVSDDPVRSEWVRALLAEMERRHVVERPVA